MTPGLVSVVMAVLNGEAYIADALESILAQDYEDFEVLVVDDGSTDRTADIVRSFPNVTLVSQANQHTSVARQAGLDRTTGEFVCFFDHDDVMMPDKLSKQVAFLRSHPDVAAVLGRQEVFSEPGVEAPRWLRRDPIFGDLWGVQAESAMFRREALAAIGGWDPARVLSSAMDVLGRLRDAGGSVEILPEVVMRRRIHGSNLSHGMVAIQKDLLQSLKGRLDARRNDT